MTNEHALLTVVRAALWGEDLKGGLMPTDCFQHLMHEAKRQTVVGLFVQALSEERYQIRLAKSDAINAFVYQNKIRSLNLKVNAVLAELCCLLRAHSIDFIVVKGQLLAQFYPQPLMRQAGDIDFYCDETNFEKARKLIGEAWNVTFHDDDEDDREQHIGFEYKGILFELHFCLLSFISPRVQRCFDEMVSHSAPYTIKVGDVHLHGGYIVIDGTNSKNRKTESVTIPDVFLPDLAQHLTTANNSDYLFSSDKFKTGPTPITPKKISDEWAKFRKLHKFDSKYQFYSLKDTGITDLLNSGIPAIKVRDQARHYDLKITESYTARNKFADQMVKNATFAF